MKKAIFLLLFVTSPAFAGGLKASFTGSRFEGKTRTSTFAEYWGVVDGSNNLIDMSGENLLTDRTEFDDWTENGTCAVTADQWRNPVDETVDADYLDNTGDNNGARYQTITPAVVFGDVFTVSVWIRSDYNHNVSLGVWELGVGWCPGAVPSTDGIKSVNGIWRRVSVECSPAGGGAGDLIIYFYPGEQGISVGQAYFYGAQIIENDEWRTGMGVFLNPSDQAVTKPIHDLAQNNNPTSAKVHLQDVDGNKLEAREFNGTDQFYDKAHHASMNIFDGDHVVTMAFMGDSSTIAAWDRLFTHGVVGAAGDGLTVYVNASFIIQNAYTNAGGSLTVSCPSVAVNDDNYHIVQVVRNNNTAVCYLDGVAGSGFDVTGYGIDAARNLAVAASSAGGNHFGGQISYTRVDAEALSVDDLASDREDLLGIATNWSNSVAWDFTRATTAYKTFSNAYSNSSPSHSMDEVAVDHPRMAGQGGGVLIEGDVTQLHGATEAFDDWVKTGTCAVTANDYDAPNGTATADELDNTGGANTDRRRTITADLGDLTGRTFTMSVLVRADTPHTISMGAYEFPGVGWLGGDLQDFYATTEWQRIDFTATATGGGNNTLGTYVVPGENGVATGVAHFWGANLTETTFATSYIPNAGAVTTQVTKDADDLTLDPHESGTTNIVLPETFCDTCAASKMTVYLEAKCEFSAAADIGADRTLLGVSGSSGTATWNRNRFIIWARTTGRIEFYFSDDASSTMTIYSAVDPIPYDEWFSIRVVGDFSDLSRSDFWINGSNTGMAYTGHSGAVTFDTTDTMIRAGQKFDGTVNANCHIRNLRIVPAEVRP